MQFAIFRKLACTKNYKMAAVQTAKSKDEAANAYAKMNNLPRPAFLCQPKTGTEYWTDGWLLFVRKTSPAEVKAFNELSARLHEVDNL